MFRNKIIKQLRCDIINLQHHGIHGTSLDCPWLECVGFAVTPYMGNQKRFRGIRTICLRCWDTDRFDKSLLIKITAYYIVFSPKDQKNALICTQYV